jgi:hypothetical protein
MPSLIGSRIMILKPGGIDWIVYFEKGFVLALLQDGWQFCGCIVTRSLFGGSFPVLPSITSVALTGRCSIDTIAFDAFPWSDLLTCMSLLYTT